MNPENIKLDDANDYLDNVIQSLRSLDRREKGPLLKVLEYVSTYIRSTRNEIVSLHVEGPGGESLGTATDELEEIVAETARAADKIMSAVETIESVIGDVDPESAGRLLGATTKIYEACAFQDITGQRVTKVVRAMQALERKLTTLKVVCDLAGDTSPAAPTAARTGDAALLNGPQLSSAAHSQDEIDRLLASL